MIVVPCMLWLWLWCVNHPQWARAVWSSLYCVRDVILCNGRASLDTSGIYLSPGCRVELSRERLSRLRRGAVEALACRACRVPVEPVEPDSMCLGVEFCRVSRGHLSSGLSSSVEAVCMV